MVETAIFYFMILHCDLDHYDSKPFFLHDTLAHDDVSHTKFGCKRFNSWGNNIQVNISGILNLFCDLELDHSRAIQSFHKTTQLMMMCYQTKLSCQRISTSEDIRNSLSYTRKSYFDYMILHCDLDLDDSMPIFLRTLWLMMMHHNNKFGSKMLVGLENIVWTMTFWPFAVTLTLNAVIHFFFTEQSGLWWYIIRQSLIAKGSTDQKV